MSLPFFRKNSFGGVWLALLLFLASFLCFKGNLGSSVFSSSLELELNAEDNSLQDAKSDNRSLISSIMDFVLSSWAELEACKISDPKDPFGGVLRDILCLLTNESLRTFLKDSSEQGLNGTFCEGVVELMSVSIKKLGTVDVHTFEVSWLAWGMILSDVPGGFDKLANSKGGEVAQLSIESELAESLPLFSFSGVNGIIPLQ